MRAVTIAEPGGPEVLGWGEVPDPVCGPGEVVVDVAATAVNRADLLQRQGFYPPPPGASDILGLECSGIVSEVGEGDRKSTRLNSSHSSISYAVFCLKKKTRMAHASRISYLAALLFCAPLAGPVITLALVAF